MNLSEFNEAQLARFYSLPKARQVQLIAKPPIYIVPEQITLPTVSTKKVVKLSSEKNIKIKEERKAKIKADKLKRQPTKEELRNAFDILKSIVSQSPIYAPDAVYIWLADSIFYRGMPVYKVGITSSVLLEGGGNPRADQVAKVHGYNPIIKISARVANARKLEKKLLRLGVNPDIGKLDGHTEFRAMNDTTFNIALNIVKTASIHTYNGEYL